MDTVLMVGTRKGLWIGTVGRGPRGLGVHRAALRHGGGLLLPGRHPRRAGRGCWPAPRRAGWARRCGAPTTSARAGRRRRTARSGSPRAPTPRVERVWQLVPGRRARRRVRRHRARRGLPLRPTAARRSRSSRRCGTTRTGPQWDAGFGGQAFHTVLPHPTDPQSVTAALSTGGVYQTTDGGASWEPRNQGIRAEFLPEGQQYPEFGQCVHKVDPAPGPARAAVPAEPRRGLPLRRPRRGPGQSIADGLPADFGFPIVVHPHEPDTVFVFPINGGDRRYPPRGEGPGVALPRRRRDLGGAGRGAARRRSSSAVMRDAMCADDHERGRPLLRGAQRRGLGLGRRGRDLAPGRRATCPT